MNHLWPRLAGTLSLCILVAGCATGDTSNRDFTTFDASDDTAVEAPADAPGDATDADQDVSDAPALDASDGSDPPDAGGEAGQEAGEDGGDGGDADVACPTGYAGAACDECAEGYVDCEGACIDDCENCSGKAFACKGACLADCESCNGATVTCDGNCVTDCSACDGGEFDCNGICVAACADDCLSAGLTCDDQCVASCTSCAGKQATCETTNECLATCSSCTGACVECPAGYHACPGGCHADVADVPSLGCMYTCDDQPCPVPANGQFTCTNGACDFTCDTANGFQKTGNECLCDTANGFVEHPTLHMCVCESGMKGCGTFCASLTDPDYGCSSSYCTPCLEPAHATADCSGTSGSCGFTCDAAGHWVASGSLCVCDVGWKNCGGSSCVSITPDNGCSAASCDPCPLPDHATSTTCDGPGSTCGFACDSTGHWVAFGNECVCSSGWKDCGGAACEDATSPANGCSGASCTACPLPAHATSVGCDGAGGTCSFTCDATGHWVALGDDCVCSSGWKDCGGAACEDATTPANGCSGAACTACPLPDHAISTSCDGAGGTCDFVCDAAGQWVKSGDQCVCAPGYAEVGGVCVVACPGTIHGSSCYWFVPSPSTWDAAQATCAASSGHLATISNLTENDLVRGLADSTFWIGLRDHSTVYQSVSADDCTNNVWLSGEGGTYTGTNYDWDDMDPCGLSSGADEIFGIDIFTPGIYVFATANSSFDTLIGLYSRINDTSDYTTCVGSSIECDDDDGPGTRSRIVRYLGAGSYTVIMDGYSGASGSYQLDVRRFDFVDGTEHGWANWASEEPNNASSSEDCVEVSATAGTWNDNSCGISRPFVCERPL